MLHSSGMPYEKRKRKKKSARRWPSNFCDRCFFAHYPKKISWALYPRCQSFSKVALASLDSLCRLKIRFYFFFWISHEFKQVSNHKYTTSERFWLQYSMAGCYHFSLVAPSAAVCFNTPQWSPFFFCQACFRGCLTTWAVDRAKVDFLFLASQIQTGPNLLGSHILK